jgi:hypothetical protein
LSDEEDFAPCILSEYQGKFSILCTRFSEDFYQRARSHGGQGGGHTLQAMVGAALEMERTQVADIRFDSEADMFVARGEKGSLRTIAKIVARLFADTDFAQRAIAHALAHGEFD